MNTPKNDDERLYHIVAVIQKTGEQVYFTKYPITHAECCTMKSKQTERKGRRIILVPA